MRHSTSNRTVWKILIFEFLHFWHFLVPIKKLFLVNFEIFLITYLKDMEFRFFAHNFFKNGPNSNFFFWNFCCFTHFLEKNTKKLFKVFLYAIFEFENFNLVFETVYLRFFWEFFILNFYPFYKFDSGPMIITIFFDFWKFRKNFICY